MVGCGKMGGALLEHWMTGGEDYTIVDPALSTVPSPARLLADISGLGERKFEVVIVAIKPSMIDDVLPGYARFLVEGGFVLSIAAGCSIARLSRAMDGAAVVRVMPNLPAAIGKGVSGVCAGEGAGEAQLAQAQEMMRRAGQTVTVDSEDMLDRVTAVAGSGPGYVFEIARAYAAAAVELGFEEAQARDMVLETMIGSLEMAMRVDAPDLETLRNSVTSTGGTTAAGLAALNGGEELSRLLRATLDAAYRRAIEFR